MVPSPAFQVRMVNGHSFLDIHTGAFCGASPECCGCLCVHFQRQRANADLLYVTRGTHFIKHWYIIPGGLSSFVLYWPPALLLFIIYLFLQGLKQ